MMANRERRSEIVSVKVTPALKAWLSERATAGYRSVSAEVLRIIEREVHDSEKENARLAGTSRASVTQ